MTLPDSIFAIALERLEHGETPSQIASSFPEYQNELVGLLHVAEMGMNIPKLIPPTPYKRHLYAEKAITSAWFVPVLQFLRVGAIPIALVIALVGGGAVVDATENSLPGQALYSLKRASEEARLTFTNDPQKIAVIHVQLLQKRLDEVKQAATTGNQASETAALAELQSQTEKTFAEAAPVATANAISNKDSSLLDSLVAVNKEQKSVLTALTTSGETEIAKNVATDALNDSKKNDQTLASIIAAVNDQTLIDLPNKISVTGIITSHTDTKITVEKNTFTVNDSTIITGLDGLAVTDRKTITGKVTVTGTRTDEGILIAKQIQILPSDDGTVKGVTDDQTPVNQAVNKVKTPVDPVGDANNNTNQSNVTPPTKASGSYITEPNTPQYSN